jgi:hypothetical protein
VTTSLDDHATARPRAAGLCVLASLLGLGCLSSSPAPDASATAGVTDAAGVADTAGVTDTAGARESAAMDAAAGVDGRESCPAGAALVSAEGACHPLCGAGHGPCGRGYLCVPTDGVTVCLPGCLTDDDCDDGQPVCNTITGRCEGARHRPGAVGAACAVAGDCASGLCLSDADSEGAFPGGTCLADCTADGERQPCPGGGVCTGVDEDGGKTFICLGGCTTSVDCRPEYACSAQPGASSPGVCLPRCTHFACDPGTSCDASIGLCVQGTTPAIPGPPLVDRQDLGTVGLGPHAADVRRVVVDVPAGTASFTLVATPLTAGVRIWPVSVKAPDGELLFDADSPESAFLAAPATQAGPYGLLFPNSPRLTVVPGAYQIALGASPGAQVKIDVLYKRQEAIAPGGTLPLVFWFPQQSYLNAQTAASDEAFQYALGTMAAIYATAGIRLGTVTYLDLPAPAAQELAVIESDDQLEPLFAHANRFDRPALHFFMIDHFNLEGRAGLLGKAGGLPGPAAFPGLARGGVAVALAYLHESPRVFAETMAHEGAHYLGLYHTSERNGRAFDPLPDTPECPASADTDGDGLVDDRECAGLGGDNLMFWSSALRPQAHLTDDQRFVLLRNPTLQ